MLRGVFGEQLGRSFGVASPPTLVRSTSTGLTLAVTEVRSEARRGQIALPLQVKMLT